MTEITSRLSTALADRYQIERHLGEGVHRIRRAISVAMLLGVGSPSAFAQTIAGPIVHISEDYATVPHAEPRLAVSPARPNHMVLGAHFVQAELVHTVHVFESTDGGRTWSRSILPGLAEALGAVDPWVAFDAQGIAHASVLVQLPRSSGGTAFEVWTYRLPAPRAA